MENLDLQLEWNHIRPYVYTHNDTVANYSNYNQALAHPLGANLNEWIGVVRYQPIFPLTIQWTMTVSQAGRDTSGSNWGADIFIPTTEANIQVVYGNKTGQGVGSNLWNSELSACYMIRHNIFIDATFVYRKTVSDVASFASASSIFQIGVRMNTAKRKFQF